LKEIFVEILEVIRVVLLLVFLEGVLSLDNAAVLGAMVQPLPKDEPVPWPRSLRWLGRRLNPILGPQRTAALKVGLLGAYLGRGLMLLVASFVIRNAWLRVVGAFYLLYLAINHFAALDAAHEHEQKRVHVRESTGFWSVVLSLELADLAFSLDNVVAAVALSDQYWVVLLGVAIGIVMMRFAATIFARMIEWEPALQHAAFLLILAIGFELVLEDLFHVHLGEWAQFVLSAGILALTIAFARVSWLQPLNAIWPPLLRIATVVQVPFRVLTWPFRYLMQLLTTRRADTVTR